MATGSNPRIRYDIAAHAEGAGEVERLAQNLERLDEAIDPQAAARAAELNRSLQALGAQQAAIGRFQELGAATEAARIRLSAAENALETLRSELQAGGAPTAAQTGRMERLGAAVDAARQDLLAQGVALEASRGRLAAFGLDASNAAAAEQRLAQQSDLVRNALASLGQTLPGVRVGALVDELRELGQQQAAIQTLRSLDTAVDRSRESLRQAEAALTTYRERVTAAGPPTRALADGQQRLVFAVEDARARVAAQSAALAASTGNLQRMGIEATDLAGAEERLAAATQRAVAGVRELAAAQGAGVGATRSARTETTALVGQQQRLAPAMAASTAEVRSQDSALDGLRSKLSTLRNLAAVALGGSLIGSLARDVAEVADSVSNLRARLQLVVGEGPALEQTFSAVAQIALDTSAELEATGTLFARVSQAGREFNLTRADALALTESINQSIAVSGTGIAASDAALTQLIQGLQSGVLRGEEFNSIMEQAPRLARALADGLGVTTGELRKMANQGALTTQVVIEALQSQSAVLQAEFEKLPPTVGRAITNLGTAWSLYVSDVDKATGASRFAAGAIDALAGNLSTLVEILFAAGKAVAALTVLRMAQSFIADATAARGAAAAIGLATTATTAHTAAVVANTAAQTGNAAASTAAVAGAGRLAGALATLRTLTFLGVITNLESIGTAIGEGIAKWLGYGKAIEDAERSARAEEAATREQAKAKGVLAAQMEAAADRAEGLNKQSSALVSQFEGLTAKGETTAEALAKVGKELDLSNVAGIQNAIVALSVLEQRGRITGDALRATLGTALKGVDLGVFEAQARAAFDASERGALRLKAVLDTIAEESLRRAGFSLKELQTGFSEASAAAVNDLDAVSKSLADLKIGGDQAGRVLSSALDKALAAANTERAVQALIQRINALGDSGQLTGARLQEAFTKAQSKLDDMRGGVNSLDEALRTMGLKTRAELTATAETLGAAYMRIAGSAEVSLKDQIAAYQRWRDAALEASGGVESGQVRLQGLILETRAHVAGLGAAMADAMSKGATATDKAASAQDRYNRTLLADPTRLVSGSGGVSGIKTTDPFKGFTNSRIESFGDLLKSTKSGGTTRAGEAQFAPPDSSGDWIFDADGYSRAVNENRSGRGGPDPRSFWRRSPAALGKDTERELQGLENIKAGRPFSYGIDQITTEAWDRRHPAAAAAAGAAPSGTASLITINLPGFGSATVSGTQAQADRLLELFAAAQRQAGGG